MTWELLAAVLVVALMVAAVYAIAQRRRSPYEERTEERLKKGEVHGRNPRQEI